MSAAFTPGPWQAEPMVPLAGNAFYIKAAPNGNNSEKDVATVGPCLAKTTAANARLIAAAPDLYSGCNALLGLIQLLAANHETPPALLRILTEHHRIAEAEAAVAKARGESPHNQSNPKVGV